VSVSTVSYAPPFAQDIALYFGDVCHPAGQHVLAAGPGHFATIVFRVDAGIGNE
jgi:hypothetical protein